MQRAPATRIDPLVRPWPAGREGDTGQSAMYSMSPGLGLGSQGAPGAPFSPRLGASAAGPGGSPPLSPRPGEQIQETGVGVLLVEGPEGKVIVGKLMPGGPAEAAGLRVGDTVISVQGHR